MRWTLPVAPVAFHLLYPPFHDPAGIDFGGILRLAPAQRERVYHRAGGHCLRAAFVLCAILVPDKELEI